MTESKFYLGQEVSLMLSGESGSVIGIALFKNNQEHLYLVRYIAAGGRQVESWWAESAIVAD